MGTDLMNVDRQVQDWEGYRSMATQLIKSGFLPPTLNTPEKVITVVMTGRELQVPMMESLRGINVIQGKPALSPQLMLAMINRSGVLEDLKIDSQPTVCKVTMKRKGRSPFTATFGQAEAKDMNLLYKDNYKKQAQNMYKWRAISACARVVCPDVIGGLYLQEEIQSHTDLENQMGVIEHQAELATDPAKYEEWKTAFMSNADAALADMQEPYDVVRWKKDNKEELGKLLDADRKTVEGWCDVRHSELIRGITQEATVVEAKPGSKYDDYLHLAKLCPSLNGLRSWFKSVQGQAQKDLSAAEFTQLIEEMKKMKGVFEAQGKEPADDKRLDDDDTMASTIVDMVDYMKGATSLEDFEKKYEECRPTIVNMRKKEHRDQIAKEIDEARESFQPKKKAKKQQ